jgi:hypothetical protein
LGRSKSRHGYSPQIGDFVQKLANQKEPKQQSLTLPSRAAAMTLRATFYSYLKVCEKEENNAELQALIANFKRTFLLKVRGCELIFALRFDEPNMSILSDKMIEMDLETNK